MSQWLRSALFNLAFVGGSALLSVALLPTLIMPRAALVGAVRTWARAVMRLFTGLIGAGIEVRGLDRLPAGACIVACKHQSALETVALTALLTDPSFVIKRELVLLPVMGWLFLKLRYAVVDRGAGPRALKRLLAQAARAKADGRPIVIFPEGTRVAPGESRAYQPGVAALYQHLDLMVVPVALNSGLAWGRRRFVKQPRHTVIEFLEPIPPGLERGAFMDRLRTAIEGASRALEGEAGVSRTPTQSAVA